MFCCCATRFATQVKSGHFAEHSPLLHDISGVPRWEKVNSGVIKMYYDEVLHQYPVVQHFYFGSLLSFEPYVRPAAVAAASAPSRVNDLPSATSTASTASSVTAGTPAGPVSSARTASNDSADAPTGAKPLPGTRILL